MSHPLTLPDLPSAISSPVLEDGRSPCVLPAGPTTVRSGPALALASLSASQVRALGLLTSGISGLHGSTSSASAGRQSSLESRLRQRLAINGSTECVLTWRDRTTASGRRYCQLVPSARPIGETASGLWPTPTLPNGGRSIKCADEWRANTPYFQGKKLQIDLAQSVKMSLALWPTPTASDSKGSVQGAKLIERVQMARGVRLPEEVARAMWPTPTASLADKGVRSTEGAIKEAARNHGPDLAAVTAAALWPTPTSLAPAKDGNNEAGNSTGLVAIRGHAIAGSSATTEKPGALNPQFVCWLMGYPAAWDACAPTAMPSSRKSRPSSSKPIAKVEK